ncbi:hypothetical protein SAMN05428944_0275 [Streptomyces sp. 1222.5]|nr:hypothetical protein BX260_7820 [Streptomyces sp. 5112.2]SEB56018.1 hypothetical protein SAMN05428944_0275 [Streptomyces sp. 1222.5]
MLPTGTVAVAQRCDGGRFVPGRVPGGAACFPVVGRGAQSRATPRVARLTPRIFAAPELAESADVTRPRRRPEGGEVDAFANSMDN